MLEFVPLAQRWPEILHKGPAVNILHFSGHMVFVATKLCLLLSLIVVIDSK